MRISSHASPTPSLRPFQRYHAGASAFVRPIPDPALRSVRQTRSLWDSAPKPAQSRCAAAGHRIIGWDKNLCVRSGPLVPTKHPLGHTLPAWFFFSSATAASRYFRALSCCGTAHNFERPSQFGVDAPKSLLDWLC